MSENAKSIVQRVLYALAGAAVAGWVSAGVWAYNDRVAASKENAHQIQGVDRDLQGFKLEVAKTIPTKDDINDLKNAIQELNKQIADLKERRGK